jgi:hypothetical protein
MEGFNIYYKWDSSARAAREVGMNEAFAKERE